MIPELVGEEKDLLDAWTERFTYADEGLHRHHRTVWDRMDEWYHGYQGLKEAYRNVNRATGPRDQYPNPALLDSQEMFGHQLRIPYAFSIVETVLPRLLSNRPRMLILPRTQASESNVENMRGLIDLQQSQINYELRVQEAAKSGLMYGLGVQKTYWRRHVVERTKVMPASFALRAIGKPWKVEKVTEPQFDDPTAEAVNVRDFFWDPYATSIDDARWVIHRAWRDTRYVLDKIDSGQWDYAPDLDLEDLDGGGAANRYQTAHAGPRQAQGMPNPAARDTDVHEVWECHDRACVVTIVDRKWIVASVRNEAWPGRLPFQCYRPTHVLNQFVGKGEIEPSEHLFGEMDAIRTSRRWAAEMAQNPVLFYSDGIVDPRTIKVGPGELNGVNGDPRELIWKLDIPDVPQSGYREAAEVKEDIERTAGISDLISGAGGSTSTATGAQLELANANARIQLKTRRAEVELIREGARHWIALNQRHILDAREVQIPAPPTMDEPERRHLWLKLGPGELAGEFDAEPEGGSTTPENIPQMRQDAQIKLQALAQLGGMIDVQRLLPLILEDMGIKNADTMVLPAGMPSQQALSAALQMVAQQLGPEGQQLVEQALHAAMDMEEQEQQGGGQEPPPEEPAVG